VISSNLATDGHITSAKRDPCTGITSACSSDQTFEDCLLLAHSELCRSAPTSSAQIALALTAWQQHKKDLLSLALARRHCMCQPHEPEDAGIATAYRELRNTTVAGAVARLQLHKLRYDQMHRCRFHFSQVNSTTTTFNAMQLLVVLSTADTVIGVPTTACCNRSIDNCWRSTAK
jgi:hypothetical protein